MISGIFSKIKFLPSCDVTFEDFRVRSRGMHRGQFQLEKDAGKLVHSLADEFKNYFAGFFRNILSGFFEKSHYGKS